MRRAVAISAANSVQQPGVLFLQGLGPGTVSQINNQIFYIFNIFGAADLSFTRTAFGIEQLPLRFGGLLVQHVDHFEKIFFTQCRDGFPDITIG